MDAELRLDNPCVELAKAQLTPSKRTCTWSSCKQRGGEPQPDSLLMMSCQERSICITPFRATTAAADRLIASGLLRSPPYYLWQQRKNQSWISNWQIFFIPVQIPLSHRRLKLLHILPLQSSKWICISTPVSLRPQPQLQPSCFNARP